MVSDVGRRLDQIGVDVDLAARGDCGDDWHLFHSVRLVFVSDCVAFPWHRLVDVLHSSLLGQWWQLGVGGGGFARHVQLLVAHIIVVDAL